jgi:hypothetical protein
MRRAQQTFVNRKDGPIYVSIEPRPECYELEPGERLTLVYDLPDAGDALDIAFIDERELVIWPMGAEEPEVLIDGRPAGARNWKFKHS